MKKVCFTSKVSSSEDMMEHFLQRSMPLHFSIAFEEKDLKTGVKYFLVSVIG